MKQEFFNLEINTNGQKLYEFTDKAIDWIKKNKFKDGILNFKDDMPAHIKSSLTNNQITLSIKSGKLLLGTWQGLYLFEHRLKPQLRKIIFHFLGN